MESDRYAHIQQLFEAALQQRPDERLAYLYTATDDDELRAAVERLLAADADDFALLDEPVSDVHALHPEALKPASFEGRTVGPYRIERLLGEGGMGAVYLAHRTDVDKVVALKVVRAALAGPARLQRFLVERDLLARLQHPHIAALLDAGVVDDGTPYFAMEYVDGLPLTEYCDARQLSVDERLALFEAVGEAVQHAHSRFIVHRDLKPSNILVTPEGRVKLLDFGIAKLTDEAAASPTETGARLLTPAYAAPEQVTGAPVTAATDVYSLGIVLYELLTGQRPYAAEGAGALQAVLDTDPERPSTIVSKTAEAAVARETTTEALSRRLRGDLDVICLKALAKEPERRYATAEAFVEDIKRHLAGLPVAAQPASAGYRLRKFVRRHRVLAASVGVLALMIGLGAALWQARVAAAERDQARREAARAEATSQFVTSLFQASDPWTEVQSDTLRARHLLERGIQRVEDELAGEPLVQAEMLHTLGGIQYHLARYDEARTALERALALRRQHLGDVHPEVGATADLLSDLLLRQGDHAAADTLYRFALAADPQEAAHRMQVLSGLALLKMRTRTYAEADSLYRLALAEEERMETPNPLQVASVMGDYGGLLVRQSRFDEAESLYTASHATRLEAHGPDHPDVILMLKKLAELHFYRGDYHAADSAFQVILDIQQRLLGETHHSAINTLNDLAVIKSRRGDLAGAETRYNQVLNLYRDQFGDEHPDVATTLNNLGILYSRMGEYERAVQILERALTMRRRFHGDHQYVGETANSLANAYHRLGDTEKAEALYRKALPILEASFGSRHPRTQAAVLNMARVDIAQQRYEEAEAPLLDLLDVWTERYGADASSVADVRQALVDLYTAWGKPDLTARYVRD